MKSFGLFVLILGLLSAAVLVAEGSGEDTAAEGAKPALKIYNMNNWNFDPNDYACKTTIEEVTGYEVSFEMGPTGAQGAEKVVLEISAGSDYDLFIITNKDLYFDLATKGAVLQLDDLIKENGPNILTAESKEVWDELLLEGKRFGVPSKRHPPSTYNGIFYRDDILKSIGQSEPTTPEDLKKVLASIKQGTDKTPLTSQGAHLMTSASAATISGAFGVSTFWKDVNGQLVPRPLQAGTKPFLAYLAELYRDGLLDQEFPANNREKRHEKIAGGKTFMSTLGWGDWQSLNSLHSNDPESSWAVMKPLKGTGGSQELPLGNLLSNRVSVIPRGNKHPDEVIKLVSAFVKPENYLDIAFGQEGVHWEMKGGKAVPILPTCFDERQFAWWYFLASNAEVQPKFFHVTVLSGHPLVAETYTKLQANVDYGVVDPTTYLSKPPAEAKYIRSLAQLEADFYTQMVTGVKTVGDFDGFVKLWLSEGGQERIDQMNEVYRNR